jgi:hypothetical protein
MWLFMSAVPYAYNAGRPLRIRSISGTYKSVAPMSIGAWLGRRQIERGGSPRPQPWRLGMDTTFESTHLATPSSTPGARWAARILTGLVALFLGFDAVFKFTGHPVLAESAHELGMDVADIPLLGAALAVSLALYLIPRTAFVGAILLTGYLGGAVFAHLRIGHPWLSHTLFPIYVGVAVWAALALRGPRVRLLVAFALKGR